jgi:hypothetical protein
VRPCLLYPDGLVIASKIGALRGADASWRNAMSREQLTQAVHDNLRTLGVDVLEVVDLPSMLDAHRRFELARRCASWDVHGRPESLVVDSSQCDRGHTTLWHDGEHTISVRPKMRLDFNAEPCRCVPQRKHERVLPAPVKGEPGVLVE